MQWYIAGAEMANRHAANHPSAKRRVGELPGGEPPCRRNVHNVEPPVGETPSGKTPCRRIAVSTNRLAAKRLSANCRVGERPSAKRRVSELSITANYSSAKRRAAKRRVGERPAAKRRVGELSITRFWCPKELASEALSVFNILIELWQLLFLLSVDLKSHVILCHSNSLRLVGTRILLEINTSKTHELHGWPKPECETINYQQDMSDWLTTGIHNFHRNF